MGEIITTDAETIYNTLLSGLENNLETPLYPGDERRLFVENGLIPVVIAVFNKVENESKKRLLKYAYGTILDALGERVYCSRLPKGFAITTLQFSVAAARNVDTVIPKGTRATADGTIYFETDEAVIIRMGELSVTVGATATTGGTVGNNYAAGSINTIVDAVPFVSGVTNLTATVGGDDGEPYPEEDGGVGDNAYRNRIKLAVTAFSTAGSALAYEYHTLSVSAQIKQVQVLSEETTTRAGVIEIYAIGENGSQLPDEIIEAIVNKFKTKNIRPLGDKVEVKQPEIVPFDIELKYYVSKDKEAECIDNIEGDGGAIQQFIKTQQEALGRDINPDKLRLLCLRPGDNLTGCYRLDIVKPEFAVIGPGKIAKFSGNLTVTHAVVEE